MQFLAPYIDAIKNLKKRYYLTPFLLLIYVGLIIQGREPWVRFITYNDKGIMDFVTFIVSLFRVYGLIIILIIFYPHASFFIQTTGIYRKIFRDTWTSVKSGFITYTNIGKNIPDDYHIRGSRGSSFTISSGYKTKRERVSEGRTLYALYFVYKFFFKDFMLRLFIHYGIFLISPILFFIAIPTLNKNGLLEYI